MICETGISRELLDSEEVRKIAADLLVNPVQVNIGNVDELVANKSITQVLYSICAGRTKVYSY